MDFTLTLVAPASRGLAPADADAAARLLETAGAAPGDAVWLEPGRAVDIAFGSGDREAPSLSGADAETALAGIDHAVTPSANRRKRVLVADMDSTMIEIETLDTLAEALGIGAVIKEISARAMNGELDFAGALRERVAMLRGEDAEAAFAVMNNAVTYTSGGRTAVRTMVANGARCALVSGGFTATTETVHAHIGFQEHHANVLLQEDGKLTGYVREPVLGPDAKLSVMEALCHAQGVGPDMACAVGDGANDLDMLRVAGLGVGYYGKPIVRRQARYRIDHTDLETLLYYQGYHRDEFKTD